MKAVVSLLLLLGAVPGAAQGVSCAKGPLSETGLIELLQSKVPAERVLAIVSTCKVAFPASNQALARLRNAGATGALLAAVEKAVPKPSPAKAALPPKLEQPRARAELPSPKPGPPPVVVETAPPPKPDTPPARVEPVPLPKPPPPSSVEQAHSEAGALEQKIEQTRKRNEADRDAVVARLGVDYEPRQAKAREVRPKDVFETTAQYEVRLAEAKRAQDELERQYATDQRQIEQRYARELDQETGADQARIAELKASAYPVQAALEFVSYDADHSLLRIKANGEDYRFTIPPERAREMNVLERLNAATLARGFDEDALRTRFLIAAAGKFPGISEATEREKQETEARAEGERREAEARAQRERREAEAQTKLPAGATRVNPKDGLTYAWIPAGKFTMGCSRGDRECDSREKPAHEVTITKGFWIGQTEVTQEAYQKVAGKNPSSFKGAKLPVESINWNEAQGYCQMAGMRLPTEAEWEYAARAGSSGSRYHILDQIAWYGGNSGRQTHEAGQKQANAWGLYDTLGNVWEWVADWYTGSYPGGNQTDPRGPASGQYRALRGGSWFYDSWNVRVSNRDWHEPDGRDDVIGVRCVGELP